MRTLKIYFDTTIPNYVFNDHVPDKQNSVKELFECVKARKYDAYISDVVVRELLETSDAVLRNKLIELVVDISVLGMTEECISLGKEYVERKIIPEENMDDALHIAFATIYEIDFLVSYNFEHIVKIKTIDKITATNLLLGYRTPRIVIPEELLDA